MKNKIRIWNLEMRMISSCNLLKGIRKSKSTYCKMIPMNKYLQEFKNPDLQTFYQLMVAVDLPCQIKEDQNIC